MATRYNNYNRGNTDIEPLKMRDPDGKDILRSQVEEGMELYDGQQDVKQQLLTTQIRTVLNLNKMEQEVNTDLFPSQEAGERYRTYLLSYYDRNPEEVADLTPEQLEHISPLDLCLRYTFPPEYMKERKSYQEKMTFAKDRCLTLALAMGGSSHQLMKQLYRIFALREGITTNAINMIGIDIDDLSFPPHFANVKAEDITSVREKMRDIVGLPVIEELLKREVRNGPKTTSLFDTIKPGLQEEVAELVKEEYKVSDYSENRIRSLEQIREDMSARFEDNHTTIAGMSVPRGDYEPIFQFFTAVRGGTLPGASLGAIPDLGDLESIFNSYHANQQNIGTNPALHRARLQFMNRDFRTMTTGQFKELDMEEVIKAQMLSAEDTNKARLIMRAIKNDAHLKRYQGKAHELNRCMSFLNQLRDYTGPFPVSIYDAVGPTYADNFRQICAELQIRPTPPAMITAAGILPTFDETIAGGRTGINMEHEAQIVKAAESMENFFKKRALSYDEGKKIINDIKDLEKEDEQSVNRRRTQQVVVLLDATYQELSKNIQVKELEAKKLPKDSQERKDADKQLTTALTQYTYLKEVMRMIKHPKLTLGNLQSIRTEIEADKNGALHGHLSEDDLKLLEDAIHGEINGQAVRMIDEFSSEFLSKDNAKNQEVGKLVEDISHEDDRDSLANGRFNLFTAHELNDATITDEQILGKVSATLNRWLGNDVKKGNDGNVEFNLKAVTVRPGSWYKLDMKEVQAQKKLFMPWVKKDMKEVAASYYLRVEGFDRKHQEILLNHGLRVPVKAFMAGVIAGADRASIPSYTGKGTLNFVYDEQTDDKRDNIMTLAGLEQRLGLQIAPDTAQDVTDPAQQAEINRNAKLRKGAILTFTDPDDPTKTKKIGTIAKVVTKGDHPMIYFKGADRPLSFPEVLFLFREKKGISIIPPEYKMQQDDWHGKASSGDFTFASLSDLKKGFLEWYGNFKKKRESKEKIRELEVKMKGFEVFYKTMKWKKEHEELVDQYKGEIDKKAKTFTTEILEFRENSQVLAKIKEFRANPPDINTFEGRWKWQGLLLAVLERYGSLYPFKEMKDWENNKEFGGFWIRAFAPKNKRLYNAAIQHAMETQGADKSISEISRLQAVMHFNMYFGDGVAAKIDNAVQTGKDKIVKSGEKKFGSKVTTPEQAAVLADEIRNQRWDSAMALFKKYGAKEFDEKTMFNLFLYFFDSVCHFDGQEYKSKVPMEVMKTFATDLGTPYPTPYFWMFRRPETFRGFANILYRNSVVAQYGWAGHEAHKNKDFANATYTEIENKKWEFVNGIPQPKYNSVVRNKFGKNTDLYNFFTGKSDFTIFSGGEHKKIEDIPNEAQKELWNSYLFPMKTQALPGAMSRYFADDQDPKTMTKNTMLTSMTGDLIGKLVLDELGDFEAPKYEFTFDALLDALKDLKNSKDLPEATKKDMLQKYNMYFFNAFYKKFKYDEANKVVGERAPDKKRDAFILKYQKKLDALGFNAITGQEASLRLSGVDQEDWANSDVTFNAIHKDGKPYKPRTRDNPGWQEYVDWKETQKLPWGIKPDSKNKEANAAIEAAGDELIPGVREEFRKRLLSPTQAQRIFTQPTPQKKKAA